MPKPYRPDLLGAECHACPFSVNPPIRPQEPKGFRDFTIVLDGPGGIESVAGVPLAGKSGGFMEDIFQSVGLARKSLALRQAFACQPTPMASPTLIGKAIKCCHPRLIRELKDANTRPKELILAMGNGALKSLSGKNGIHDWRGYPIEGDSKSLKDKIIFPTFHPSFVLREPWFWPVLKLDIKRALELNEGARDTNFPWPKSYIDDDNESIAALARMLNKPQDIGVDIEGWDGDIFCISVASKDESVCVAYPMADDIDGLVRSILASDAHPKVLQNGNYDRLAFRKNDVSISVSELDYDLLPTSRVAFPQLPHDLGFILSVLFFFPRYKTSYQDTKSQSVGSKGDMWRNAAKNPDKFRDMKLYCSRDSWGTVIAKPRMETVLKGLPIGE